MPCGPVTSIAAVKIVTEKLNKLFYFILFQFENICVGKKGTLKMESMFMYLTTHVLPFKTDSRKCLVETKQITNYLLTLKGSYFYA